VLAPEIGQKPKNSDNHGPRESRGSVAGLSIESESVGFVRKLKPGPRSVFKEEHLKWRESL